MIVGGDTVCGLAAELGAADDGRMRTLAHPANLAGQAVIDAAATAGLAGRSVQLAARDCGPDLARLVGWLEGERGWTVGRIRDVRDLRLQADVSVTPNSPGGPQHAGDARPLQRPGHDALRYAEAAARGRFEAQLTSDGLSIEQVPDISTLTAPRAASTWR